MTTFLIWVARIVILAIILRMVLRLVFGARARRRPAAPHRTRERIGGTLVQDPQCGTYVPESRALLVGRGPDAKRFCSAACRDAYLAAHGHRHAS